MAKNELKNLPPEERIKRLKQLEEERKKEIEEAQRIIKESEDELTERKKWVDKVPIPEFASEDLAGLSAEAKEIVQDRKGVVEKKDVKVEPKKKEISLEETLAQAPQMPRPVDVEYQIPREATAPQLGYDAQVRESSASQLHERADSMYKAIAEKGYANQGEVGWAQAAYTQAKDMLEDTNLSKEVANQAMLTRQVTGRLLDRAYHSGGGNPDYKV